jgi:hypothetical protein
MDMRIFLFTLFLPLASWADGMVGVPDVPAPVPSTESGHRSIVINGNADTSIFERRLAGYFALRATERAEADARRRQQDLEMAAALRRLRGTEEQAAREARDAADAESRRRQREAELEAALGFGLSCSFYDPNLGCHGPGSANRP